MDVDRDNDSAHDSANASVGDRQNSDLLAGPGGDPSRSWPAVVIGAGQAGLATAGELVRRGLRPGVDFIVLDGDDGPGGAWQHRWDSLTLDRAHAIADLPGLKFPGGDPQEPSSSIVSRYYGAYERHFGLRVVRPVRVLRVESTAGPESPLQIIAEGVRVPILTRLVVNATGTWTRPFIPAIPGIDDFKGRQLHTAGFTRAEDFAGSRTLVVGGGLSAVQFLLQLAPVTETIWATRRPPAFTSRPFDVAWGADVEHRVDERTAQGLPTASVVSETGIPLWPDYVRGVSDGVLVSRGMFDRVGERGVRFSPSSIKDSAPDQLVLPESWQPYREDTWVDVDVIFWNTGFRYELRHLAPLKLRAPDGGIPIEGRVHVTSDPRVLVAGYGSGASTLGATRTGKLAAKAVVTALGDRPGA